VPISGHTFCGQSGQGAGFAGLWQGISSALECSAFAVPVAIAKAYVLVNGIAASAPSMASMPRTANQRWKMRFFTVGIVPQIFYRDKDNAVDAAAL